MDTLAGKVALVTGGASGIGLATARAMAAAGARIVIADLDEQRGRRIAADLDGRFVALDVGDAAQWSAAVEDIIDTLGGIDVAHLNAGVATGATDITALTDAQYRRAVAVNVDGVVFGVRAVAGTMALGGGGAIVATASLGGLVPMPSDPIYSLTKHAVVAFVRSVAPQLSDRGITCNAVCPGFADTPLMGEAERAVAAEFGVPLLDAGTVADAVLAILASDRTGEAWYVQPGRPAEPFGFRNAPGPR